MKCRWCDHQFKRGGPRRAWYALAEHVYRVHPDQRDKVKRIDETLLAIDDGDLDCSLLAEKGFVCDVEEQRREK